MPQGAAPAEATNPPRALTSSREIMRIFFMTISDRCKVASTLRRPLGDTGSILYFSKCNWVRTTARRTTAPERPLAEGSRARRTPADAVWDWYRPTARRGPTRSTSVLVSPVWGSGGRRLRRVRIAPGCVGHPPDHQPVRQRVNVAWLGFPRCRIELPSDRLDDFDGRRPCKPF